MNQGDQPKPGVSRPRDARRGSFAAKASITIVGVVCLGNSMKMLEHTVSSEPLYPIKWLTPCMGHGHDQYLRIATNKHHEVRELFKTASSDFMPTVVLLK